MLLEFGIEPRAFKRDRCLCRELLKDRDSLEREDVACDVMLEVDNTEKHLLPEYRDGEDRTWLALSEGRVPAECVRRMRVL